MMKKCIHEYRFDKDGCRQMLYRGYTRRNGLPFAYNRASHRTVPPPDIIPCSSTPLAAQRKKIMR